MSEMRWIRVLGFAAVYFFIFVLSAIVFTIKPFAGSPELMWYLQHPWIALRAIFSELIQSPLLMLSLFIIILNSFILGVITDWIFRTLKRHILLRKRKPKNRI